MKYADKTAGCLCSVGDRGRCCLRCGNGSRLFAGGIAPAKPLPRAVVTDIHAGPLEAARRTLTETGVLARAELLLCDGLEQVLPEGITDVVVAGMGGETIVHILENCPWRAQVHLILQPMTKLPVLRQWLAKNGFDWTEQVVSEGGKFYVVLDVRSAAVPQPLTLLEQEVGRIDWQERVPAPTPAGS